MIRIWTSPFSYEFDNVFSAVYKKQSDEERECFIITREELDDIRKKSFERAVKMFSEKIRQQFCSTYVASGYGITVEGKLGIEILKRVETYHIDDAKFQKLIEEVLTDGK